MQSIDRHQLKRCINEAARKGDIPQSQEVGHWYMLAGGELMILAFANDMAGGLCHLFLSFQNALEDNVF